MNTPQETYTGVGVSLWNSRTSEDRSPVICAWCEQVLEEGIGPVSHGMCPGCHAAFLAMIPVE